MERCITCASVRCHSRDDQHVRTILADTVIQECVLNRRTTHLAGEQCFLIATENHDFVNGIAHSLQCLLALVVALSEVCRRDLFRRPDLHFNLLFQR